MCVCWRIYFFLPSIHAAYCWFVRTACRRVMSLPSFVLVAAARFGLRSGSKIKHSVRTRAALVKGGPKRTSELCRHRKFAWRGVYRVVRATTTTTFDTNTIHRSMGECKSIRRCVCTTCCLMRASTSCFRLSFFIFCLNKNRTWPTINICVLRKIERRFLWGSPQCCSYPSTRPHVIV